MYESKILLMADLTEFPYAQHYAECFSLLFADLGSRLERNATTPARHDYYKVYIAVKDSEKYRKIIDSHKAEFPVELIDELIDYTKLDVRKASSYLVAHSFIDPFDDVRAEKRKRQKAEELAEAERQGKYLDPNEDAKLDASIPTFKKRGRKPNDKYS